MNYGPLCKSRVASAVKQGTLTYFVVIDFLCYFIGLTSCAKMIFWLEFKNTYRILELYCLNVFN